jgi:uncharacterized damage-inducible protein DinB
MTTGTMSHVAAPLALIYAANDGMMKRALDGLSESDLWHQPTERSNPMFWLLGHIVHTRGAVLRMLGDDYRTGWGERFQRGSTLLARSEYPPLDEIERVREEISTRLQQRLASVSDETLAAEATGLRLPLAKTLADQVAFLALHDSYHVGQLGYVRKMLGHSGISG